MALSAAPRHEVDEALLARHLHHPVGGLEVALGEERRDRVARGLREVRHRRRRASGREVGHEEVRVFDPAETVLLAHQHRDLAVAEERDHTRVVQRVAEALVARDVELRLERHARDQAREALSAHGVGGLPRHAVAVGREREPRRGLRPETRIEDRGRGVVDAHRVVVRAEGEHVRLGGAEAGDHGDGAVVGALHQTVAEVRQDARAAAELRVLQARLERDARGEPAAIEAPQEPLKPLLVTAVAGAAREDGWALLSNVGSLVAKSDPSFDPRNYGCEKLGELISRQPYLKVKKVAATDGSPITHIYVRNKEA